MSYLVDTCTVSELVKPRPDPGVLSWLEETGEGSICLSVITLGELWKGIVKLKSGRKREALLAWIREDLPLRFAGRLLPISESIACEWGRISGEAESRGRKLPVLDALVGAPALVHDLTVVTRNVADIESTGARVLNPWGR